jgi:hypothetical protein
MLFFFVTYYYKHLLKFQIKWLEVIFKSDVKLVSFLSVIIIEYYLILYLKLLFYFDLLHSDKADSSNFINKYLKINVLLRSSSYLRFPFNLNSISTKKSLNIF